LNVKTSDNNRHGIGVTRIVSFES